MPDPKAEKPTQAMPLFDARGKVNIERRGVPRSVGIALHRDLYHFLRATTWTRLLLFMVAIYLASNLVFAAVLYFGDAAIANARPGSFADRFWFSVQTMATVGYGVFAPADRLAHVVVTIESFFGIMITAMATGLFFAKFSTPQAKVMFTRNALIADHDGVRTLMFRMANARETAIVEATVKVAFLRDEILASGERVRRIYDIVLRRNTSPMFALSWMVYHPIDASSPLAGATPASLEASEASLTVTFTGIDDRLATTVHTRTQYSHRHILFGHRFVDMLINDPDTGMRVVDYTRFDDTYVVAPTASPADPAAAG